MSGAMLAIALSLSLTTPSPVDSMLLSRSGKVAAAICRDHKMRIWSLPDATVSRTIDITCQPIALTAISDDGRSVLVSDYQGEVGVWDTTTGKTQLEQHVVHYLTAAAFSHDGRLVAIASGDEPVRIIDLATKRVVAELERSPFTAGIAFSRDDKLVGTADGDGIRIFNAGAGKLVSQNNDFSLEPLAVNFTPDGEQVIAGGADKVVFFIDALTGKTVRRTTKTAHAVMYVEVSPDGKHLAIGTFNADNMLLPAPLVISDVASLEKNTEWNPPTSVVGGTWTADGNFVAATATPDAVRLWRIH